MSFEIDFSDRHSTSAESLDAAISVAQGYIAEHPRHQATFPGMTHQVGTTATVYSGDKSVAMVTASAVQTLHTDPGF